MEDIIDIIVTETTNLIEITSQPTDEIIDVNIIDNRENVTLNVTPTVVEININSLTGNFGVNWGDIEGTLSNQTDLQNVLNAKADLVDGKVPSSQLPSYVDDVVEVANYASLPATGEVGKIYITLDTNKIYRWSGSTYIEIADSTAVWGAITGTLSSQTDLQSALDAKFDEPTGDTTQYIAGDGSLITFPVAGQAGTLVREVRNTTGATLTKGTIVYISGATGNKPTVSKAIATGDSTSAQTFGICQANIANNSNGYVVCVGDITGLDTSAISEGVQLYLSSTTAGEYTTTKQLAPAHLVYIGVVTRSHPTLGQIEVKIQNGYELDEIHDVAISSKANNDGLFYESATSLWKNKSIATALGYTPADDALVVKLAGTQTITGTKTFQQAPLVDIGVGFKNGSGVYNYLSSIDTGWQIPVNGRNHNLIFSTANNYVYTFPNATGTIALTSNLSGFVSGSGATGYYARFTSSGVISDGFIQTTSNITYVEGMGLSTGNGLDIEGAYGAGGGGLKIRSYDETTGNAYIDFANTSGRMYLGLNKSTSGGLMTNATAYATVLTTGLGTTNLEFGTNATKRLTIDGTSGAITATSSVTASALYVTGMTAGSGAIYHTGSRLTFANYNASGTLHFEVNGGAGALTLNADKSATFEAGGSFGGGISATTGTFSGNVFVGGSTLYNPTFAQRFIVLDAGTTGDNSSMLQLMGSRTVDGTYGAIELMHQAQANRVAIRAKRSGANNSVGLDILVTNAGSTSTALDILPSGAATFSKSVSVGNSGNLRIDADASNGEIIGASGKGLKFYTNDGITNALTLASGGAATFSSSVTANGTMQLANDGDYGSTYKMLAFTGNTNGSHRIFAGTADDMYFAAATARGFEFRANGGISASVKINSSGNVGINTSTINAKLHVVAASANVALFNRDTTDGDILTLAVGGNNAFIFNTTTNVRTLETPGAVDFRHWINGAERMRITSGGGVEINNTLAIGRTTEAGVRLSITATTADFNGYAVIIRNSTPADLLAIRNDGLYITGTRAASPYNNTTGAGANMHVASDGILYRSTSSIKYKKNVLDYSKGLAEIMQMRAVTYEGKSKADEGKIFAGLIAEEVHDLGLTEFVQYAEDGTPDALAYQNMVSLLIKGMQELKAELDTLKNK